MGRSLVMHIDEAPSRRGELNKMGEPIKRGGQFFGDMELGPWVLINALPAGFVSQPHTHDQDEVIYIVEGKLTLGDRECGPGTLIFNEKHTAYGFTVGDQGVRFLNIRPEKEGLGGIHYVGKASEHYRG